MNSLQKNEMERLYTPKEIAEMMNVHHYTILIWIKNGKIPAVKVGKGWRISQTMLNDFYRHTFGTKV